MIRIQMYPETFKLRSQTVAIMAAMELPSLRSFISCPPARKCEALQAGGLVDPAGRVQVAEEALPQPAPDLQRLLQAARHHR